MGTLQRYIFILSVFLLPVFSFGQFAENTYYKIYHNDDWIDARNNRLMSLTSSYFASPYSAPAYLNTFILLHYNEDDLYQEVSGKLEKENYFGIEMNNKLMVWPVADINLAGKNFGIGFTLGNVYEQKLYFTNDLFTLMYEGNASLTGTEAQLAPLSFRALNYQEIGISLLSQSTGKVNFGLEGLYLNGNKFYELNVPRGAMFTSDDGDSIFADLSLEYRSSDPEQTKLKAFNGSGAGISACMNYSVNAKSSLFLVVDKLGFISWNNKSTFFSMDTSGSYTGFDFFDTAGLHQPGSIIDTFSGFREGQASAVYTMWLKPRANLIYTLNTGTKGNQLSFGITYRFDHFSFPGFSLQYLYKPINNLYLKGGLNYDEYKYIGGNLELGFRLFEQLVCTIGSYHVEQFFTSMNGQSLYFGIAGVFGKE